MNRPAVILALVATFLIGASLGLMGGIMFTWHHNRPPGMAFFSGPPHGGPPRGERGPRAMTPERMLSRLRETLDLTDEQAAKIEPILREAHTNMDAARDSLRARVDRVLTPEQRERWRRLEAHRGFPGETRGPKDRANRALPGSEGEER